MNGQPRFAEKVGRSLTTGIDFVTRRFRIILFGYGAVVALGCALLYLNHEQERSQLERRSWGGFDERPNSEKCYRQERVAMLLSLFLGLMGVDQFYAHHWPLAVFKLLTLGGFGIWGLVDMILWIVGGVYGTPGCPGGNGWRY